VEAATIDLAQAAPADPVKIAPIDRAAEVAPIAPVVAASTGPAEAAALVI